MPKIIGETRKRGGSIRKNGGDVVIEIEYEYLVQADTKDQLRIEILTTPGLPVVNQTTNGPTICTSIDAETDPINPIIWRVNATFSSEVDDATSGVTGEAGTLGDPVTFVPIAELGWETRALLALLDAEGTPVLNSAGQPFETGFTRIDTLTRYNFEQFEPASTTDDQISARNLTVNDAEFRGKAAKTLLLTVTSATLGYYYGYRVWRVGYSMLYNKRDWRLRRLDTGINYLDSGQLEPYLDNKGFRINGNLNGSGAKAAVGSYYMLTFDQYPAVDFTEFLRLPATV